MVGYTVGPLPPHRVGGSITEKHELTYYGILVLSLARASGPFSREKLLLAMKEGGVLADRCWVAVP